MNSFEDVTDILSTAIATNLVFIDADGFAEPLLSTREPGKPSSDVCFHVFCGVCGSERSFWIYTDGQMWRMASGVAPQKMGLGDKALIGKAIKTLIAEEPDLAAFHNGGGR